MKKGLLITTLLLVSTIVISTGVHQASSDFEIEIEVSGFETESGEALTETATESGSFDTETTPGDPGDPPALPPPADPETPPDLPADPVTEPADGAGAAPEPSLRQLKHLAEPYVAPPQEVKPPERLAALLPVTGLNLGLIAIISFFLGLLVPKALKRKT